MNFRLALMGGAIGEKQIHERLIGNTARIGKVLEIVDGIAVQVNGNLFF